MLTGRVPFEGSIGDLFRMHVQEPVPPMPGRLGVSNELESVVRRALAKDREDRFENMGEMADAIRDALASPSRASAAAEPEARRTPPIVRRPPALPILAPRGPSRGWIGAGVIVLAGVVGLVIALFGGDGGVNEQPARPTANMIPLAVSPLATVITSASTNRIAFSSPHAGNYDIYVMNADGSGQTSADPHVMV